MWLNRKLVCENLDLGAPDGTPLHLHDNHTTALHKLGQPGALDYPKGKSLSGVLLCKIKQGLAPEVQKCNDWDKPRQTGQ